MLNAATQLAALVAAALVSVFPTIETSAIVNGSAVPDGSPEQLPVVSIQSGNGDCTGVFIDVDMILTAAHCIQSNARDMTVTIGTRRSSRVVLAATGARVHEGHDSRNRNDLALIRVEPRFDIPYVPAPIAGRVLSAGMEVTAVGYGRIERNDPANEQLHRKDLVVADKRTDKRDFIVDQRRGGICDGDSGGPAFVQRGNRLAVAGIASYVFSPAGVNDICRGQAAYVDLRYYRGWIEKAKAELR